VAVHRETRLVVGQRVMPLVDLVAMQPFVDGLPQAGRYASDGAMVYREVVWPDVAPHVISVGKEETYTIEGINADLRTYLGRLKRRSRCFSRSIEKLAEAVRLFVWHDNRRQRAIAANPKLKHTLPLLF
jgi:hypothetical protein